jgi:hypothetical protein
LKPKWIGIVESRFVFLHDLDDRPDWLPADAYRETMGTYIDAPSQFPEAWTAALKPVADAYYALHSLFYRLTHDQRRPGDDGDAIVYHCEVIARALSIKGLPEWRSQPALKAAGPPALQQEAVDAGAFRPAAWFGKPMAPRLRQAASRKRKSKRVATRTIDGVVCYSVADARRWWPTDVPKEA